MLEGNALWLHRNEAIECSQCSMGGGALRPREVILRIADTGNLTDVGMEREDLGPMMSTF